MPSTWDHDRVDRFLVKLSHSDPGSIDAFLEDNREDGSLGKYLIARQLKQRENVDMLFPPNDAGWYRYLFDQLLVDGRPHFDRSRLTIVTFNYDRSLEAYFYTRLQAAFGLDETNATEILRQIPIIHVHGILGEFPRYPYQASATPDELELISQQIQIIHEIQDLDDDFCNDQFERAHDALELAQRIYFLGFGFHLANLRRFRFFTPTSTAGVLLRATAQGFGTVGLNKLRVSLGELGFPADAFDGHDCGNFFNYAALLE